MTRNGWCAIVGCLTLLGCDDTEPLPDGQIVLVEGREDDAWTAAPVPVRAEVERILQDGSREPFVTLNVPPEPFSMGTDGIASFEVNGFDASDMVQVWGRSYPMNTATLAGFTLPLFVGRAGRFSRPPGSLQYDHGALPPVALLGERWILAAGASDEGMVLTEAYDLGLWTTVYAPELRCPDAIEPCTIRTLAVVDSAVMVAIGDGFLRSFVFGEQDGNLVVSYADAALAAGLDEWTEVAGGSAMAAPDGDVYVVGSTRPDAPTNAVLRIVPGDSAGAEVSLRTLRLQNDRAGAAAAWVEGHGLIVVGGSTEAPGAEVLAEGATDFVPLPFDADPTVGAAIAGLAPATVLRIGGRDAADLPAPTVTLPLDCETDCMAQPAAEAADLRQASAFSLADGSVLCVGTGSDELSEAVRYRDGQIEPAGLREPRRGARALAVSTGHVALVGGVSPLGAFVASIELFAP